MFRGSRSRQLFFLLCLLPAVILPVISFDFGITEDEQLHNQHGKSILGYFLGTNDLATRNPIDANGELIFEYDGEMNDLSGALNIYGGLFDLICAATYRYISPFGEFETRHLVNACFGVLLIVMGGLTAARVAGWRAGILALALLSLSPRIVGHSMNNPVDLPFAALYMFSLYFMIRFVDELPSPSPSSWIPLLIGISVATDVRIAGLALLCYLPLFVFVRGLHDWRAGKAALSVGARTIARSLAIALLLCAGSYLLISLPWPLAHRAPLSTPVTALSHLSALETFDALDLFEGRWIHTEEIPWYFVLRWLYIGTPLFIPLGLLLSPLLVTRIRARRDEGEGIRMGLVALVAFAALFPVVFIIARDSNIYNDARHALFAYPPLVVFCAVVFEHVLRSPRRIPRTIFAIVLAFTLVEPLQFMVRNHPNQGVYFSPLIGGVRGAWRNYETDFWGNSVREAVEWIQEESPARTDGPVRVRLWYGDQTKAKYYLDRHPGTEHVVSDEKSADWDYRIAPTVECKYFPRALELWPPPGTVYEMKAGGVPLGAVVINPLKYDPDDVLRQVMAWTETEPTHAGFYRLSAMFEEAGRTEEALAALRRSAEFDPVPIGRSESEYLQKCIDLYASGHFEEMILAARMAIKRNPQSSRAYHSVCVANIQLKRWEPARSACESALKFDPNNTIAQADLKRALAH